MPRISGSSPRGAAIDSTDSRALADHIRRTVIEQAKRAHVGHIGSALSIADILAALYGGVLHLPEDGVSRDRLILSKGHAALALYAALAYTGALGDGEIDGYCADGSALGVHPESDLAGVDFCTGSLGHGLSIGVGCALAARLDGSPRRAFVVMSDAELNEGSVWEAVMFAAHHRLANLVAVVDVNGQQALGYTRDVLDLAPVARRLEAFGWDVHEVDGHDLDAMTQVVTGLDFTAGAPHILLATTTFGRGVRFMESVIDWHYLPMTDEQYEQALAELDGARA